MAKRKQRSTYMNEVGGAGESQERFGSFMNDRQRGPLQYGGQPAVRTDRAPQRQEPTRRQQRAFDRQQREGQGLAERFVNWVGRTIAQPIIDWISDGEPDDAEAIASIQQSLAAEGHYDGPVDGTKNEQFMAVLEKMRAG